MIYIDYILNNNIIITVLVSGLGLLEQHGNFRAALATACELDARAAAVPSPGPPAQHQQAAGAPVAVPRWASAQGGSECAREEDEEDEVGREGGREGGLGVGRKGRPSCPRQPRRCRAAAAAVVEDAAEQPSRPWKPRSCRAAAAATASAVAADSEA
jgi:hypothetical protein